MLDELKKQVYEANMLLQNSGLVIFTWGNVSGISEDRKYVAVKPSGVAYEKMKISDIVITDMDGIVVDGDLAPSIDLPTHLEVYKKNNHINGIVHTHSQYATSFAQASKNLECYGTTHADYFNGKVYCTRHLTKEEVLDKYEKNTGIVINEYIKNDTTAILVAGHGPFTFGLTPLKAVETSIALEYISKMNITTMMLNEDIMFEEYLLRKHFDRKHGSKAYYGQQTKSSNVVK